MGNFHLWKINLLLKKRLSFKVKGYWALNCDWLVCVEVLIVRARRTFSEITCLEAEIMTQLFFSTKGINADPFQLSCFLSQDCDSIQQTGVSCVEPPNPEVRRVAGLGNVGRQRNAQVQRYEKWVYDTHTHTHRAGPNNRFPFCSTTTVDLAV